MKKNRAVFPGSFDPITNGHMDIIERSAQLFDEVIVSVLINASKQSFFSIDERIELINHCIKDMPNVKVKKFDGLLVDFVDHVEAKILVRGVRGASDFEYEQQMSYMNAHLKQGLETVFLLPKQNYSHISSRLIKEVGQLGGNIGSLSLRM